MKSSAEGLTIGEAAERFGLATHVLRHWEAVGLLTPARSSGRRRYTDDDLYRVAAIVRAKQAGLGLDQIHRMIAAADPAARAEVLRDQREQLQRRLAATQQALDLIDHVLGCDHDDFTQCPEYRRWSRDAVQPG